jgi:hypothetical protein
MSQYLPTSAGICGITESLARAAGAGANAPDLIVFQKCCSWFFKKTLVLFLLLTLVHVLWLFISNQIVDFGTCWTLKTRLWNVYDVYWVFLTHFGTCFLICSSHLERVPQHFIAGCLFPIWEWTSSYTIHSYSINGEYYPFFSILSTYYPHIVQL